jgi:hypothetical protein
MVAYVPLELLHLMQSLLVAVGSDRLAGDALCKIRTEIAKLLAWVFQGRISICV